MYFTYGTDRAYEKIMSTKPGFDKRDNSTSDRETCYTCDFYRPFWNDRYCVYKICPFQSGRKTFKKSRKNKKGSETDIRIKKM